MLLMLSVIETTEERNAVEQIFDLYYKRMYVIAFRILHNQADAEDAAMDAMRYVCERPRLFMNYRDYKTVELLKLKAECCALDIYRRNKRNKNAENELVMPSESETPFEFLINKERKKRLLDAIMKLDAKYRIPLLLKYYYQMNNQEIAAFMSLTVSMISVRIHRGKQILKDALRKEDLK